MAFYYHSPLLTSCGSLKKVQNKKAIIKAANEAALNEAGYDCEFNFCIRVRNSVVAAAAAAAVIVVVDLRYRLILTRNVYLSLTSGLQPRHQCSRPSPPATPMSCSRRTCFSSGFSLSPCLTSLLSFFLCPQSPLFSFPVFLYDFLFPLVVGVKLCVLLVSSRRKEITVWCGTRVVRFVQAVI